MMVRREVFDEVGGFDEELPVAFNDVDFCLKLRERGLPASSTPPSPSSCTTSREAAATPTTSSRANGSVERWGRRSSPATRT